MLSKESGEILSTLLMKFIQGERSVEISRKTLAELYSFSPSLLFSKLCKVYRTELIPRDIKEFLAEKSVEANDDEVYMLVRQYSAGQNGRLNFEDFTHLVLPSTNQMVSEFALSRNSGNNDQAEYFFVTLLKNELKLQKEAEDLKIALFSSKDFSLWKAFEALNTSGSGSICEEEFRTFLRENKKFINEDDYDALMRRIDLQDDLVINYNEFLEALIPMKIPGSSETRMRQIAKDEEQEAKRRLTSEEMEEEVEGKIETQPDVGKEVDEDKDEPMDSHELEHSPRFKDPKEFTLSQDYETPEKGKSQVSRNLPSRKSGEAFEKFSELFLRTLEISRKVEFYRQNLVMLDNFSVIQLFKQIDRDGQGEINISDFIEFSKALNLEFSSESLESLFKKYASKEKMTMDPNEFSLLFYCFDKEYQNLLRISDEEEEINQETYGKIRDLLEILVISEEIYCNCLKSLKEFNSKEVNEVFEAFDCDQDGEISVDDMKSLLKSQGIACLDKDCLMVIQRFTKDKENSFTLGQLMGALEENTEDKEDYKKKEEMSEVVWEKSMGTVFK
ncbi:hypothetical protein SteCoe_3913 [Stentor coeruleus]|uniref:EF-hand domain-containing protein n=1 Tax=Stentor coeruleus TaxID=5963 RepID=A0A1R2CW29_9CILI|nr:hypothetical protein SteCoe_3913 [Stentor coeruleus]